MATGASVAREFRGRKMDEPGYVVRRPRYEVRPGAECVLVLTNASTGQTWRALLGDLSRNGLKAFGPTDLSSGMTLQVHAEFPSGLIQFAKVATVRWSKSESDGQRSVGLEFDAELSWEVMGEMFLNNILSL